MVAGGAAESRIHRLNDVSSMECSFIAGHCQLPCASEELQPGAVEAAVQGAAL